MPNRIDKRPVCIRHGRNMETVGDNYFIKGIGETWSCPSCNFRVMIPYKYEGFKGK